MHETFIRPQVSIPEELRKSLGHIAEKMTPNDSRRLEAELAPVSNPLLASALAKPGKFDGGYRTIEEQLERFYTQFAVWYSDINPTLSEEDQKMLRNFMVLLDKTLVTVRSERLNQAGIPTRPKQENAEWLVSPEIQQLQQQRQKEQKAKPWQPRRGGQGGGRGGSSRRKGRRSIK